VLRDDDVTGVTATAWFDPSPSRRLRVRRSTALRTTALALCVASTAGCQLSQLQFTNDHRLSFESPQARHRVQIPVTVSWSMKDFEATGLDGGRDSHQGAFAVFVDRAPMPVGKDLKWLAKGDTGCKRDLRCPDAHYLADRGVYVTTSSNVKLETLPAQSSGTGDEQHYVNVVLLDGTGHRIGESAWYRPFTSKRRFS
jgi:hypothetical protein